MNIDPALELKYLQIIQKRPLKWTLEEREIIINRDNNIDKQFLFDTSASKRLELLNTKLLLEEKRIFPFYHKLLQDNNNLVTQGVIDDYNIDLIITCERNEYFKKLFPDSKEDYCYETNCDFIARQETEDYVEEDWRETGMNFLSSFKHCYSFHHLYDHTDLLPFDLCQIDNVWIDLKVDYQFQFKLP
jgi:hypothetical protein